MCYVKKQDRDELYCPHCHETKNICNFYKGRWGICKPCHNRAIRIKRNKQEQEAKHFKHFKKTEEKPEFFNWNDTALYC